jgi:hypothetical protein
MARLMGTLAQPRREEDFPTFAWLRDLGAAVRGAAGVADSLTDEMVGETFSYVSGSGQQVTQRRDLFRRS